MRLSASVQRELKFSQAMSQGPRVNDYYVIGTKSQQKFLVVSLQAWHIDQSGCDGSVLQGLELVTKHVATPCDICGVQGLRRHKSCDVSGCCDVCPPQIAMFTTFVGVTGDEQGRQNNQTGTFFQK